MPFIALIRCGISPLLSVSEHVQYVDAFAYTSMYQPQFLTRRSFYLCRCRHGISGEGGGGSMTSQPTYYRCKVLAQRPGAVPKIRLDRASCVPNVMQLDSNLSPAVSSHLTWHTWSVILRACEEPDRVSCLPGTLTRATTKGKR